MPSVSNSILLVTFCLAGPAQAISAFSKMIDMVPASPPEGFTSSVLSRSLEAPEGIQLLSVSVLLLVFAVLVTEQHDQTKADEKSPAKLLRAEHFAFRLGIMACLCGLVQVAPASPPEGLNPTSAIVEAPTGIQLLSLAALLLVFAVAVCEENLRDSEEKSQESDEKSQILLVKADAIAFRAGIFACLLGLVSMRACFSSFTPTLTSMEAPEGIQSLTVSILLLVFAVLVLDAKAEEEEDSEKQSQVELLKVEAIAFRSGLAAGLIGLVQVLNMVQAAVLEAMRQGQEGYLLLAASASLLLLAAALRRTVNSKELDEIQREDLKLKGRSQVRLVRPDTVAFRAAAMTGLTGVLKTTGTTQTPGLALWGEITIVLASAAAVAVCK